MANTVKRFGLKKPKASLSALTKSKAYLSASKRPAAGEKRKIATSSNRSKYNSSREIEKKRRVVKETNVWKGGTLGRTGTNGRTGGTIGRTGTNGRAGGTIGRIGTNGRAGGTIGRTNGRTNASAKTSSRTRRVGRSASQPSIHSRIRPMSSRTNLKRTNPARTDRANGSRSISLQDKLKKLQRTNDDMEETMDDKNHEVSELRERANNLRLNIDENTRIHEERLREKENMFQQTLHDKENIFQQTLHDKTTEHLQQLNRKDSELQRSKMQLSTSQMETKVSRERIQSLQTDLIQARSQNEKLTSDFEYLQKRSTEQMKHVKTELSQTSMELEMTKTELETKSKLHDGALKEIENLNTEIEGLNGNLREAEEIRKRLHNTVQELKGNIRVYCRLRPSKSEIASKMSKMEIDDGKVASDPQVFKFPEGVEQQGIGVTGAKGTNLLGGEVPGKEYSFSFDRVFKSYESQSDVFSEICQLVQSALDGYKVCVFAYGQTGSGKTYTMEGAAGDKELAGMIPRAVEQVFKHKAELQAKGWEYKFSAVFLEIYNEEIRNLLAHLNKPTKKKLDVLVSTETWKVPVSNVEQVPVKCHEDVFRLLKIANDNRATGKTDCNERSSRSHSVFMLYISGHNAVSGERTQGVLNLIDLAGSEDLRKSNAKGDRLTETQHINKSLSALKGVIAALNNNGKKAGKRKGYVPYRDSKLTSLLQNYFGGDSKTLMFVNLSPEEECVAESINSLRFATKVNACQIGSAKRDVKL